MSTTRQTNIDALRGWCLFGLLMVHCAEYFELYWSLSNHTDSIVFDTVLWLFGGKAYALFALLFGVSFAIMTDATKTRPLSRYRFSWRLILLGVIGLLHGLLYLGDILTVLALAGLIMVSLSRLSNRWQWVIAAICLLQLQLIFLLVAGLQGWISLPSIPNHWQSMPAAYQAVINSQTLIQLFSANVQFGQWAKWDFMFESGRFFTIIGMAILGQALWRNGFFASQQVGTWWRVALLALLAWVLLVAMPIERYFSQSEPMPAWILGQWLSSLKNLALTISGLAVFLLFYHWVSRTVHMQWLANTGKMGLSVYVAQSFFGVPLFYPLGLSLYHHVTQWQAALLGVLIFTLMVLFANLWLRYYRYGPLEWLWRSGTLLKKVPLKRTAATLNDR